MQKVIENAMLKIVQAMEKNRKAYAEAEEWYRDTGYDRYWKKMERLDKEYEELKEFIGLKGTEEKERVESVIAKQYKEIKEQKKFIADVKSLVDYIHADYWGDRNVQRLHEKLKDNFYKEGQA